MEPQIKYKFNKPSALPLKAFNEYEHTKYMYLWQEVSNFIPDKPEKRSQVFSFYLQPTARRYLDPLDSPQYDITIKYPGNSPSVMPLVSLTFQTPEDTKNVLGNEELAANLQQRIVKIFSDNITYSNLNEQVYQDIKNGLFDTLSDKEKEKFLAREEAFNASAFALLKELYISAEHTETQPHIKLDERGFNWFFREIGLAPGSNYSNFKLLKLLKEDPDFNIDNNKIGLKEQHIFGESHIKSYNLEGKEAYCENIYKNKLGVEKLLENLLIETCVHAQYYEELKTDAKTKERAQQNLRLLKNCVAYIINNNYIEETKDTVALGLVAENLIDKFSELTQFSDKVSLPTGSVSVSTPSKEELQDLTANMARIIHAICVKQDQKDLWERWEKKLTVCEIELQNKTPKKWTKNFLRLVGVMSPAVEDKEALLFSKLKSLAQLKQQNTDSQGVVPTVEVAKAIARTEQQLDIPMTEIIVGGTNITALQKELAGYRAEIEKGITSTAPQSNPDLLPFKTLSAQALELVNKSEKVLRFCASNHYISQDARLYLSSHLQSFIKNYQRTEIFVQKNAELFAEWPELNEQRKTLEHSLLIQISLNEKRLTELKAQLMEAVANPILQEGRVNTAFLEQKINQSRQIKETEKPTIEETVPAYLRAGVKSPS